MPTILFNLKCFCLYSKNKNNNVYFRPIVWWPSFVNGMYGPDIVKRTDLDWLKKHGSLGTLYQIKGWIY